MFLIGAPLQETNFSSPDVDAHRAAGAEDERPPVSDSPDSRADPGTRSCMEQVPGSESGSAAGALDVGAATAADDVERAGGFGAADGIGSFLPVAMDSTDFEASLRDARAFEGPQHGVSHPGLGWTEPRKPEPEPLTSPLPDVLV